VLFLPQLVTLRTAAAAAQPWAASSDLVTTSGDDVPMVADQQTVVAADVEWSYDLLSRRPAARRRPGAA
jgi:hypothetical protein